MNSSEHGTDAYLAEKDDAPDYYIENYGTLFLATPLNESAWANLRDNVQEDAQFWGDAVVVEHRYIVDLVEQLQAEGWKIA